MSEYFGIQFFTKPSGDKLVLAIRGADHYENHPGFKEQCFLLDSVSASGGYVVDRDLRDYYKIEIPEPTEAVFVWSFNPEAQAVVAHVLDCWSRQHRAGYPLWTVCPPFNLIGNY